MKQVLIFSFCFLCCGVLDAQIKLLDSLSGEAIAFAHIISEDSVFHTISNAKGEFEVPSDIRTIVISCIGYKTKTITKKDSGFDSEISLSYSTYYINEASITAKRIDIYKEVNELRKRLLKEKRQMDAQFMTTFETINDGNLIERADILTNDFINIKNGFVSSDRVFTNYRFDTSAVFIHVDLDKLVRQVKITSKSGLKHLLNRGEINRSNTKLQIIDDVEGQMVVTYEMDNQEGYLRFDKNKYSITEYRICSSSISSSIYDLVNQSIGVEMDTFTINYEFNEEMIDNVSFHLSYSVESLGEVTTEGSIRKRSNTIEWLSTNKDRQTIQFDAYLTSFLRHNYPSSAKSIFFNIKDNTSHLVNNNELTYNILCELNHTPRVRFWADDSRLGTADFILFDQNIDISRKKEFRSDFHNYGIDWLFYKDRSNSNKLLSLPSIWNSKKAVFISKTKYHSLLLANLTFDIYEIHKKQFMRAVSESLDMDAAEKLMHEYYNKADKMVAKMNRSSNYGNSIFGLLKYNQYVLSEVGIDNIEALVNYKSDSKLVAKYSDGDVLLATGNTKQAIQFYSNMLEDGNLEIGVKKRVFENMIQAFIRLEKYVDACTAMKEWRKISDGVELDLGMMTLDCE